MAESRNDERCLVQVRSAGLRSLPFRSPEGGGRATVPPGRDCHRPGCEDS
jgi:hypothetical protein